MRGFLQENWFKVALIVLVVWFLIALSSIAFGRVLIEVCLKEASGGLPNVQRCW